MMTIKSAFKYIVQRFWPLIVPNYSIS